MTERINFLKEAIQNLKTLGTLTPSSRFLSRKMLKNIDFSNSKIIVELGPGNGAITKHILPNLHPDAKLICFEINETFYQQLQALQHNQLKIVNASATDLISELAKLGIQKVDHIVSSLPLTNIPEPISKTILNHSYKALSEKGTFIQYQYSLTYHKKLKQVFENDISLGFEVLNFPPAFIYRCKK